MREVEEELRHAKEEVRKAGGEAAERERLAQGGAGEEDAQGNKGGRGGEGAGSWAVDETLRMKLREVFDQMDLNKVSSMHREGPQHPELIPCTLRGNTLNGSG